MVFSLQADGSGNAGYAALGFTWISAKNVVTYELSQYHTNGSVDPFMLNGYMVKPTSQPDQSIYPWCSELHCSAGVSPCSDSLLRGEYLLCH
jgi:hypothetical protein